MNSQAWDEPSDGLDLDLDFLDTSQYSQNTVSNPITTVNFSSITNIAGDLLYNGQDLNSFEQSSPIPFDPEDKFDDIAKGGESALSPEGSLYQIINDLESATGYMPCEEVLEHFTKQLDIMELELIDQSIQDRQMRVAIQPPTDIRRRYKTDGKRQIEKSRSKPMAIKLPDLKNCKSDSQLSFWLQLYLVTTDQNPANTVYIHSDELEYHVENALPSDYGSVCIPITSDEVQEGVKQLARISIIKTKLDSYTFKLIPFSSLSTNPTETIYENKSGKSAVAKAKCFREDYHLTSSRIICQLLIKQNDTWRPTDIVCETDIMEEKKQADDKTTKKRAAYKVDDNEQIDKGSPTKKPKKLPVTHVAKNHD